MTKETFTRWLKEAGLTYDDAAFELGVSRSQVGNLAIGFDRTTMKPTRLTILHRYAMVAIIAQIEPIPGEDVDLLARLALAAAQQNLQPWPLS